MQSKQHFNEHILTPANVYMATTKLKNLATTTSHSEKFVPLSLLGKANKLDSLFHKFTCVLHGMITVLATKYLPKF